MQSPVLGFILIGPLCSEEATADNSSIMTIILTDAEDQQQQVFTTNYLVYKEEEIFSKKCINGLSGV